MNQRYKLSPDSELNKPKYTTATRKYCNLLQCCFFIKNSWLLLIMYNNGEFTLKTIVFLACILCMLLVIQSFLLVYIKLKHLQKSQEHCKAPAFKHLKCVYCDAMVLIDLKQNSEAFWHQVFVGGWIILSLKGLLFFDAEMRQFVLQSNMKISRQ